MESKEESKNSRVQSSPSGAEGQMHYGASRLIFIRAEELRKFPTHEELVMWGYLSGNKLGVKFRRQHPNIKLYCRFLLSFIKAGDRNRWQYS
jgi:hypothetical protein